MQVSTAVYLSPLPLMITPPIPTQFTHYVVRNITEDKTYLRGSGDLSGNLQVKLLCDLHETAASQCYCTEWW